MKHIDLFSGIGGFALAADRVFGDVEHTFVEYDPFCQAILKKHYPNATIHGDIRQFITDTERGENNPKHQRPKRSGEQQGRTMEAGREATRQEDGQSSYHNDSGRTSVASDTERKGRERELRDTERQHRLCDRGGEDEKPFILTGGFPCQPFSVAGRRKGTDDDRYLWPEMFRVIQLYKPTWVIAENVAGINTMVQYNEGFEMEEKDYSTEQEARIACEESHQKGQGYRTGKGVLGTILGDLEKEGYSVQTFIIPACAVQAPHQRERVWIVAHRNMLGDRTGLGSIQKADGKVPERNDHAEPGNTDQKPTSNTRQQLREQGSGERVEADTTKRTASTEADKREREYTWANDWREVALATCNDGMDDGLPRQMDGVTISSARHRKERLKACGNAIVPQVAEEIMRAISNPYY